MTIVYSFEFWFESSQPDITLKNKSELHIINETITNCMLSISFDTWHGSTE